MAEDVILAIPNNNDPFRVEADASKGAVGVVLSQQQSGSVVTSHLHVKISECHRTELRDLQQGIAGHHASPLGMATLSYGRRKGCGDLDGSPEPPVFPTTTEAELTTSALGDQIS